MASFARITRHALVAVGMGGMAAGAHAINMTIPTTLLDAESQFNFSSTASRLMDNMGIEVLALGNTKNVGGSAWNFMMPVTQVTLNASIFPLGLTPVSGYASGSGLMIRGEEGALTLSNFGLDFERNILTADLSTANGLLKKFDVYSFKVDQGLHVSLDGGLGMKMSLIDMTLTSGAQSQFASALSLEPFAVAVLSKVNFGSLDVDINAGLRFGLSDKALVAAVPEASPMAMLALGLVGIAFVSRRRLG